jgi:DNA-binding transcriptional LysR family regulator
LRKGRIAIAALPSLASSVLPKLVQDFMEKHPRMPSRSPSRGSAALYCRRRSCRYRPSKSAASTNCQRHRCPGKSLSYILRSHLSHRRQGPCANTYSLQLHGDCCRPPRPAGGVLARMGALPAALAGLSWRVGDSHVRLPAKRISQ